MRAPSSRPSPGAPRVAPEAGAELAPVARRALGDPGAQRRREAQRRLDGAQRVVGLRRRQAEEQHRAVAHEAEDEAVAPRRLLLDERMKRLQQGAGAVRAELLA